MQSTKYDKIFLRIYWGYVTLKLLQIGATGGSVMYWYSSGKIYFI